jgi:hypothetical protein
MAPTGDDSATYSFFLGIFKKAKDESHVKDAVKSVMQRQNSGSGPHSLANRTMMQISN